MSFGYKYGIPIDADLLFDVRFLPNPHYDLRLRPLTGLDAEVSELRAGSRRAPSEYLERLFPLLDFLFPRYAAEGKAHLTIGVGCTGGRHRSVTIAAAHRRALREAGLLHRRPPPRHHEGLMDAVLSSGARAQCPGGGLTVI